MLLILNFTYFKNRTFLISNFTIKMDCGYMMLSFQFYADDSQVYLCSAANHLIEIFF